MSVNVADVSGSGDISARCDEVSARLKLVLSNPRLRRLDALVLGTGGATGEPTVLVPWTTFVPTERLFESPDEDRRARTAWLGRVAATCRAAIRPSLASPVYEAADRALAAIASRCADLASSGIACARKLLAIESDLRSTWGGFGRYMRAIARHRRTREHPKPLALGGVELYLCGLSNTDAKDGLSSETVMAAWTSVLGRRPEIDPTCAADPAPSKEPR